MRACIWDHDSHRKAADRDLTRNLTDRGLHALPRSVLYLLIVLETLCRYIGIVSTWNLCVIADKTQLRHLGAGRHIRTLAAASSSFLQHPTRDSEAATNTTRNHPQPHDNTRQHTKNLCSLHRSARKLSKSSLCAQFTLLASVSRSRTRVYFLHLHLHHAAAAPDTIPEAHRAIVNSLVALETPTMVCSSFLGASHPPCRS